MSSNKSKELDKFYTNPEIAKIFVDKINSFFPLKDFDLIIEPSAGSGNILKYLPSGSIGIDLEPEGEGIIRQDFFDYNSPYHPLINNIRIACIGNPPFGTGYMNPLAKAFFNHAASFSEVIAFIVPAKWHTSWKVHFQLDKSFGLYFSEILPKNSFLFNEEPYDVNCCMQIWSRVQPPNLENIRFLTRPPTKHEDFDMFLTCDNVPKLPLIREQLKNKEYWEFGLKYWGNIHVCDMEEIPVETTTHYLFKAKKPYVRKVFESIEWKKYITNMGAPNVGGKSLLVKAYTERKREMQMQKLLTP